MILKILCRAHYEVHGSFERFKHTTMLKEYADIRGMDLLDAFHENVGYVHDEVLVANKRSNVRKLASVKSPILKKIFETGKMSAVNEFVYKYGCVPFNGGKLQDVGKLSKFVPLIRVLTEYFKNSPDLLLQFSDREITIGTFLNTLKTISKKGDYVKYREQKSLVHIIEKHMPEIVISAKVEVPMIYMGKLYLKDPVPQELWSNFITLLVDHMCIHALDVPDVTYFKLLKSCMTYQTLEDSQYLEIVDLANSLNVTVKRLFELCGLSYVNMLDVFDETGCAVYLRNNNSFEVYSGNSKDKNDFVNFSREELDDYHARGILKTLTWEGPVPYLYNDGERLFVGQKMSVFSGS